MKTLIYDCYRAHYSGEHRGGSGMRPHTDDVYGIPLGKKK